MAFYDAAFTYDSGQLYDQVMPPTKERKMIQIVLDLKNQNDAALKQYSLDHIAKIAGNAAIPTPLPAAAAYQTVHDAFSTALTNFDNAQTAAHQATLVKDAARAALEAALTQRARNIEGMTGVTEAIVVSAGMTVKSAKSAATIPVQVANLVVTTGDNQGELDAMWNRVDGARAYEIQIGVEPIMGTNWQNKPSVTKSKTTLTGLPSGAKISVRVRAIGSAGPGPWSETATRMVP